MGEPNEAISQWRYEDSGYRQRLRGRFLKGGSDALEDDELVEMALFAATSSGDTGRLARALLSRFGTFEQVVAASGPSLREVPGVCDAAIAALKLVEVAAVRLARGRIIGQPILGSWEALLDYCHSRLSFLPHEEFHVLFLDRKNRLIADERQGSGTIDHTPVYPRKVIKRALEHDAAAIILVHNHPSGDAEPSRADIQMTHTIEKGAAALGIAVHDHLIVGANDHVSLRERGLLTT